MCTILCHPVWSRTEFEHFRNLDGYVAMEIYNHTCHVECNMGYATIYWDSLLRRGKRVWGIASDDSHHILKDSLGGWVMVNADALSPLSIIDAVREGRFYSSTGPAITDYGITNGMAYVNCSPVREIHFVTYEKRGRSFVCDARNPIASARYELTGKEKYVRVECTDDHGRTAWTNPIFLGD